MRHRHPDLPTRPPPVLLSLLEPGCALAGDKEEPFHDLRPQGNAGSPDAVGQRRHRIKGVLVAVNGGGGGAFEHLPKTPRPPALLQWRKTPLPRMGLDDVSWGPGAGDQRRCGGVGGGKALAPAALAAPAGAD